MIVALLGTTKAGAAYVPLAPSQPPVRLIAMIEDAKPFAIVAHASSTPPESDAIVVEICEKDLHANASSTQGEANGLAGADDPAYVIFTSRSTGRPKGAVNAHQAVVNRLLWMRDTFSIDGSDVFIQKTPFGPPINLAIFGIL